MTSLVDELLDLYEPIARACCRAHRLSEDLVDDVTHDTFIAAYKNLPKYRGQTKLSSWLWIIARSKIINQLREQSKCRRIDISDALHQSLSLPGNPVTVAQSEELRQKLHTSIAALPYTWMTVVKLYYWHHKNTYEIAMHMQIKPAVIRVILHRSRQRLRKELKAMP
jgi:RNA polymerase sigma-70 factor (ECF subfamily)